MTYMPVEPKRPAAVSCYAGDQYAAWLASLADGWCNAIDRAGDWVDDLIWQLENHSGTDSAGPAE